MTRLAVSWHAAQGSGLRDTGRVLSAYRAADGGGW